VTRCFGRRFRASKLYPDAPSASVKPALGELAVRDWGNFIDQRAAGYNFPAIVLTDTLRHGPRLRVSEPTPSS